MGASVRSLWFAKCASLVLLALATTVRVDAQARKKTSTRSANVQTGSIVSVDTAAGTVVLKPKTGSDITYQLTDKTHVLKGKKVVDASEFKPGDAAVVRFRKSIAGPSSLYDLADKASWEWLDRLRHETTAITIVEVSDEALKGAEGTDKAEVDYRVTEKTTWQKGGKPASATDFKAGEKVFVVPRLLPGGNVMAMAVADAPEGAAVLKEHAKATVSGTVKALDSAKRVLQLRTAAGEDRELPIAPDVIVRLGSKDVPLTSVRPGQSVSVHLTRSAENELAASRVTIQTRKSTTRRSAKSAKPVVKMPVKP